MNFDEFRNDVESNENLLDRRMKYQSKKLILR